MDLITTLAQSIQEPVLTYIDQSIGNSFVYVVLILLLMFFGEPRKEKRNKLCFVMVLAILGGGLINQLMAQPRPCSGEDWCPSGFSFPSMHATAAFALATGFLGKRGFPLYMIFALFVSFTRLNLGVHVFYDIVTALPIALFSYYTVDLIYRQYSNHNNYKDD